MRIIIAFAALLLISGNENVTDDIFSKSMVLMNATIASTFSDVVSLTEKPKMVVFYSSENCGPCLKQLEIMKPYLKELDNNYQIVFVDSWTIGMSKKYQSEQKALEFYKKNLKTNSSIFLLDPEDALLATYQENETLKNALPYLVIQDPNGNEIHKQLGFKANADYSHLF